MPGGCTIFKGKYGVSAFIICLNFLNPVILIAKENEPIVEFSLKPRLCVLSSKETQCGEDFFAEWKAQKSLSLCIFQENNIQPLHCWENVNVGNAELKLLLNQSTAFELREIVTQKTVAKQTFEVFYEQKKYSKNRRNPWSFF